MLTIHVHADIFKTYTDICPYVDIHMQNIDMHIQPDTIYAHVHADMHVYI